MLKVLFQLVGPTHDAFDLFCKKKKKKKKKKNIYIYIYNIHFSFPEVKVDIYNFQLQNLFFT